MLVDSSAETAITKTFHRFIGHRFHFSHVLYAKKLLVMKLALANDVEVLGNMLDRLSEQDRRYRDLRLEALSRAVRETIACFPSLSNLRRTRPAGKRRRSNKSIERAILQPNAVTRRWMNRSLIFLRDVLLFRSLQNFDPAGRAAYTHFILKFQQTTAPVMAKGLEDTMFYIYNRLPALNEVGGEPQQFGLGR